MKTISLVLTTTALTVLAISINSLVVTHAAPPVFKPTLNVDDHDNPVYTSPTNDAPPANHWMKTNSLPIMPRNTNWPVTNLPPITNWPTTNLPAMTNPPPLRPPGDK